MILEFKCISYHTNLKLVAFTQKKHFLLLCPFNFLQSNLNSWGSIYRSNSDVLMCVLWHCFFCMRQIPLTLNTTEVFFFSLSNKAKNISFIQIQENSTLWNEKICNVTVILMRLADSSITLYEDFDRQSPIKMIALYS